MSRHDFSVRVAGSRGVALIMVLAVLAALTVLAVPFLASATSESASSVGPYARARAHYGADAVMEYGRYWLTRGHAAEEALRKVPPFDNPGVDTPEEVHVPIDLLAADGKPHLGNDRLPLMNPLDPRGFTADLRVRDEQSLPNLWSSPPFLIASVLGRSVVAKDIQPQDTEIFLDDGEGFPLENGRVVIEGEVIQYGERDGNALLQCQRGVGGGLRAATHRAEAWVLDDRARLIAMAPFRSPRAAGEYRAPVYPSAVKEITLFDDLALSPNEVDRLTEAFSTVGFRYGAGDFGRQVAILRDVDPSQGDGDGFPIQVRQVEGFVPGMVVRIGDSAGSEYGMVARVRAQGRSGTVWLYEPPQSGYGAREGWMQPLLRHPVNINGASTATLNRLFYGLQLGNPGVEGNDQNRIEDAANKLLVGWIEQNRPIRDLQHLRELLSSWSQGVTEIIFNEFMAVAVFRNAVNPTDRTLVLGTVPLCFESYDHYTLEARSVVNDQSGRELARAGIRERIHVSPLGLLRSQLDSQADFESAFFRSRLGPWTCTHPRPTGRVESEGSQPEGRLERMLYRFGRLGGMTARSRENRDQDEEDLSFADGVFGDRDVGDVRLLPARMFGNGYTQHFDGPGYFAPDPEVDLRHIDAEGRRLREGVFEMTPRSAAGASPTGRRQGRPGGGPGSAVAQGALQGRTTLNPVIVDMWYRTGDGGAGRQVVFEYGRDTSDEDRISLSIEADGSLLGRVGGRTIDVPGDGLDEVSEVRWMPDAGAGFWRPNTWYHLGIGYRSTRPDDVCLFVDGFPRGRAKYLTRLVGRLDPTGTGFEVEDAQGWPQQGVAWVGPEVVAFQRSGESFQVVTLNGQPWGRGQRGTRPRDHGSGTVVSLYGYSTAPRGATNRTSVVITPGGARLRDALGPPVVATFAPNATVTLQVPAGGGLTIPVPLEVHDPTRPNGDRLTLQADSYGTLDFDAFPASGGYIVIVSANVGLPGSPVGGIELAYYSGRSGNVLQGVFSVLAPPNPELVTLASDPQSGFSLDRRIHPVRLAGTGPVQPIQQLAAVFPISVGVEGLEGLPVPEMVRGGGGGASGQVLTQTLPAWHTDPEFIQVGNPDAFNLDANNVEWIRYHHVDPAGHLLCDEGRFILAAATLIRARHLGQGQGILLAHEALRVFLPMRQQCDTLGLSDGRHPAGGEAVPCVRTVAPARRSAINVNNWNQSPESPTNGLAYSAAGWGDVVTIEGPNGADLRTATVAWAGVDAESFVYNDGINPPITFEIRRDYEGQGWIAFTTAVGAEYRQRPLPNDGMAENRERYVRLLKFPSGELPDLAESGRAVIGGTLDGQSADPAGYVDEIRVRPFQAERYVLWNHGAMGFPGQTAGSPPYTSALFPYGGGAGSAGVDATTDEIPLANVSWLISNPRTGGGSPSWYILPDGRQIRFDENLRNLPNRNAGFVLIDRELIAFRSIGNGEGGSPALLNCQRGMLGTLPESHGFGANVTFLDFMTVSMLSGALDASSHEISVVNRRVFRPEGGTLLLNDELLHYTSFEGTSMVMPLRRDRDGDAEGGLFRGRFGTAPRSHDTETIVVDMPFRYWDRYSEGQDDAEMSWYGTGWDLPGAFFHEVNVEVERSEGSVDVELLVRTDSRTAWTAEPLGATNGLFRATLEGPSVQKLGVTGDGVDIRVHFRYLSGAFDPITMTAHGWKATPVLHSLGLSYLDQTRVITREELR